MYSLRPPSHTEDINAPARTVRIRTETYRVDSIRHELRLSFCKLAEGLDTIFNIQKNGVELAKNLKIRGRRPGYFVRPDFIEKAY